MDTDVYNALLELYPWVKGVPRTWQELSHAELVDLDMGNVMVMPKQIQDYCAIRIGIFIGLETHDHHEPNDEIWNKGSFVPNAFRVQLWNYPQGAEMWERGLRLGAILLGERRSGLKTYGPAVPYAGPWPDLDATLTNDFVPVPFDGLSCPVCYFINDYNYNFCIECGNTLLRDYQRTQT